MHVRIGDTVQVIAGREKGKVGEVTRLFKHNSTVIVKDLNLKSKHKKGTDDEPGEIVMVSKISIELVFGPHMMLCIYWFQEHICSFRCLIAISLSNLKISFDQIEGPIHSSNVMLYSKEKSVASRVGHKFLEDGTKVRYLVKTGEVIDSVEKWVKVFKEGNSE